MDTLKDVQFTWADDPKRPDINGCGGIDENGHLRIWLNRCSYMWRDDAMNGGNWQTFIKALLHEMAHLYFELHAIPKSQKTAHHKYWIRIVRAMERRFAESIHGVKFDLGVRDGLAYDFQHLTSRKRQT